LEQGIGLIQPDHSLLRFGSFQHRC
jgi:hypothetical protein